MSDLLRKGDGKPIRDAMRAKGLSGPALSARTKNVDIEGRGISPATVGKVAGQGETAHDGVRWRTAWLIARVLHKPIHTLFDMPGVSMPGVSTATDERLQDERDAR